MIYLHSFCWSRLLPPQQKHTLVLFAFNRKRAKQFNLKECSVVWRLNMFHYHFPDAYHLSLLMFAFIAHLSPHYTEVLKSVRLFCSLPKLFCCPPFWVHLTKARTISLKSCYCHLKSQICGAILVERNTGALGSSLLFYNRVS